MRDTKKLIDIAQKKVKPQLVFKNANVLNVFTEEFTVADVAVDSGYIASIGQYSGQEEIDCTDKFLIPGFIDSHTHIESTMVTPTSLAKAVLKSGTTTLIADPHELVNVSGSQGMRYFLNATEQLPLNVYFMLPSSVPATPFETNGSSFTAQDMAEFAAHSRVLGLGEVMCYPAVINGEEEILRKIALFEKLGKPADGHAPSLSGNDLQAYAAAGIISEHECSSFAEAAEKVRAGLYVLVREGSAAKNLSTLIKGLLDSELLYDRFLFCTDDKHLDDIERDGHVRWNVRQAINLGIKPAAAIKMATYNAARAYNLRELGAVSAGYRADLVLLDSLKQVTVNSVYKDGILAKKLTKNIKPFPVPESLLHSVNCREIFEKDIQLKIFGKADVIELIPYQITTRRLTANVKCECGYFIPDEMFSKLVVVERYGKNGNIAVAPLKGYGIKNGAIATSVAHDSHNIIAAGDNDTDIALAINTLREISGGYVLCSGGKVLGSLALPVGGIMSEEPAKQVAQTTSLLIKQASNMGIPYHVDPFISLSFLALPVIPEIRLTDNGLFDVCNFKIIRK